MDDNLIMRLFKLDIVLSKLYQGSMTLNKLEYFVVKKYNRR